MTGDVLDPGPAIADLVGYAITTGLVADGDARWAVNRIIEVLRLDDVGTYHGPTIAPPPPTADDALAGALDLGVATGLIEDTAGRRDLLDAALMGALMAPPSVVTAEFWHRYAAAPEAATDYFYRLSEMSNYIHAARVARNPRWVYPSRYGDLDMTINLAKPEKDPRDIIAAGKAAASGYPTCLLCPENEGYAGRLDHPGRQNLRLIELELAGSPWFFQYSPYVYYPEHCIVLSAAHEPMRLTRVTFTRLLQFVDQFGAYFIGSNADLPIVGGSILSHDHFQGGRYEFPIERAAAVAELEAPHRMRAQVVDWPLSVLRITGSDPELLADTGFAVLEAWRGHDVPATGVRAWTGDTPHNTVTPIARRAGSDFQLDVVLRNNRTSAQHPDGIFHPHAEIHPVKKENIGLIEVMGLAVLPARLAADIPRLAAAHAGEVELADDLAAHRPMLDAIPVGSLDAEQAVRSAVGAYFTAGLEHCAVLGPASSSVPYWAELLAPLGFRPV
ncbi:MAG: UDP-glucose--hexose-1-phosphate uridylyltransferase [Actinobacteria bacterium]|nr:UDP-glucose--hexose-1-phosphate uridylyltransferase [Actinomycetota bacterium]MCB9413539.1 UDP-glucose--hexose-1-phosphate uridylyltransferase [Actinomycetota bacterium]